MNIIRVTVVRDTTSRRFVVVGVINTMVDFAALFALVGIGVPRYMANIISTSAAFATSFAGNKSFTFRRKGQATKRQMVRFVIVTLFSIWVIATGIIALLTPLLDTMLHNVYWSLLIAKIVATIASSVWNYVVYARYVFVETDSP